MENLISKLTAELQVLKEMYIKQTGVWAVGEHQRIVDKCREYINNQDSFYKGSRKKDFSNSFYKTQEDFYKAQKYYDRNYNTAYYTSTEEFVEKMKKDADKKFNTSVEKLALRISKKGLDENKLKIETSNIDVNINTTITDGIKTVKASTILAWGEIQRPHYRYLVK